MSKDRVILGILKNLPNFIVQRLAGPAVEIDGNRLDANIQLLAKMAGTPEAETDINKMRADIHANFTNLDGKRRASVKSREAHIPGPAGDMLARIYEPANLPDNAPAVLFFHQGGLVVMDLDTDDAFCTILADECKAKVISLDYRLCPEHNFPAPIDDAMALWDYVQANAAALGIDGARVAVAGDSAGGLISSVICQQVRDAGGVQPAAQLLAYPWVSTQLAETGSAVSCAECFPLTSTTMEFFNATVFPEGKHIDHPFANPLHNDNLANLPPAIIGTAGFDPIRDQGNDYADRLKAAGNQVTHYCFNSLSHSYLSLGNVSKNAEKAGITLARDLAKII
jgi:acetyl esterase